MQASMVRCANGYLCFLHHGLVAARLICLTLVVINSSILCFRQSRELGLSEIVPTEKAILMMELKDYFEVRKLYCEYVSVISCRPCCSNG